MTSGATSHRWRDCKLEDLVFFQRGFDITQAQQSPGPYPVVSSSGVTSYHSEFMVSGPGVVIGRKGTLGSIHFVEGDYWPHDTTLWSRDLRGNDARFIYYFLHTIDFKRFDVGNSNPTLNRNHIHALPVCIPPLPAQRRISEVLCAYDGLIETNRRRMALLEDAARQLYDEWFVRLRFPGREHTPVTGGLPKGWDSKTFGDLCFEVRECVSPSDVEPDTPYIGLEHIPRRSITLSDWGRAEVVTSTKHRYRTDEIIFGKIRPYFHKVGFALTDGVASSDAIVMRATSGDYQYLALAVASSDHFVKMVSQTVREGSKMPRADWKMMQRYPVRVPPKGLLSAFNEFMSPILEQLRTLALQAQKARVARDLLLPRLMSGELEL
jgi:type I restriction enzyme S subunit